MKSKQLIFTILIACLIMSGLYMKEVKENQAHKQFPFEVETINSKRKIVYPEYKFIHQDDDELVFELRNESEDDFKLSYSDGKKCDLILYKDNEKVFSLWQSGGLFTQEYTEKILKKDERQIFRIKLENLDVEPGKYMFEFFSVAKEVREAPNLLGSITLK